jgi:NAD(P)-dependent dehydrogenase (short-subunit alcohol dehydrogenase family)
MERNSAVIFGCSGDVGKTICKRFSEEGYSVVVADLKREAAEALASDMNNAVGMGADVRSREQVDRVIGKALKECGKIDVLVNCSRAALFKETVDLTEEEWDTLMDYNAKGTYHIVQSALKSMIDNSYGTIIGVASRAARSSPAKLSAYSASMNAVIGFFRGLSCEVRDRNIRVNALCPGYVEHEELLLGAELTGNEPPEEGTYIQFSPFLDIDNEARGIADMAVYLAGEHGRSINGQAYGLWDDEVTYLRNLGLEAEVW